ncbi:transcriptional regulator [Pseudomonas azotoformans]|uniref:Transcriptional regulator n=1 Tax=Pseudomonas azotoformans TaxID=47878 RepID=A0A1V2J3V4_PSEAZ|nr:GlxA family transcriptional regulator [Pseudomonas azotoformans]OIN46612.1 transcriptional regulator [Pseudomonas azotoformans]ONH39810.1 transcriptional regulator [Pseudomonas azotoformans]SDM97095.1 Transcriptional regulator GlxA family, contains an amidase domain and an AraC-type DNA-binding HTH domain [Pseudomonas azotoformans]
MHITLLLADRCSAASATTALEMLSAANLFADQPPFEVAVASLDGHAVEAWGGQRLQVDHALAQIVQTDLVLIPGFLFTLKEALPTFPAYAPWLREQHARGAVLASMCTAAFLLAESGVLQGLRATTHWAFAELFRRRYTDVSLDDAQLLCEENRVITSGGASAAMDLMLHLIRRFGSPELAHTCGRYLLIDNVRSEQSVYAMWSLPKSHGDAEILRVQHWLEQHFAEPVVIDEVARQFSFGVRNFKRRFKEATGFTPIAYLQTLRLERAKQMLESTRMTLESITYAVGYEDSNSFRRLFLQRVGVLPAAYRKKFLVRPV